MVEEQPAEGKLGKAKFVGLVHAFLAIGLFGRPFIGGYDREDEFTMEVLHRP